MNKPPEHRTKHEVSAKRAELHGKRRELHKQLSDVCEEFAMGDLTKEHKQKALVRELRYLLDYYQDEEAWKGIE
jgi:hypothetical protein